MAFAGFRISPISQSGSRDRLLEDEQGGLGGAAVMVIEGGGWVEELSGDGGVVPRDRFYAGVAQERGVKEIPHLPSQSTCGNALDQYGDQGCGTSLLLDTSLREGGFPVRESTMHTTEGLSLSLCQHLLLNKWMKANRNVNKAHAFGASLVAQWLRICLPCRGHGFEPWSGKIPHAAEQLGP